MLLLAVLATAVFSCEKKNEPTKETEQQEEQPNELIDEDELHSFFFTVLEEPTEKKIGSVHGVCSDCGLEIDRFIPALNATDYQMTGKPATCTEKGQRTYTSIYGEFTVEVDALRHDYKLSERVEPTCEEDGYTLEVCSRCRDEKRTVLNKLYHSYEKVEEESIPASCHIYEHSVYRCSVCGKEMIYNGEEYAHQYDEGVHFDVPCNAEEPLGYTIYTCTECGFENKVYDKNPRHIYNKDTGTCTVCGETCKHSFREYTCTICGLNIEERVREDGFFLKDENGNGAFDAGEKVYFGFYPTRIADKKDIDALRNAEPEGGYYVLNGVRYVRKALDCKNKATARFSNDEIVASYAWNAKESDEKYNYYYYRVEPILWTVKSTGEEGVLLESDYVLDVVNYRTKGTFKIKNNVYYTVEDGEITENYANSWEESELRSYLNGEFLTTAFDERQRSMLRVHQTKNGHETQYYSQAQYADGDDTEDNVFVAAYRDLFEEDEAYDESSETRRKKGTDYVRGSGGTFTDGYVEYYTRSAGSSSARVGKIDSEGKFDRDGSMFSEKNEKGETLSGVGFAPYVLLSNP